jgi:hypothetical protein
VGTVICLELPKIFQIHEKNNCRILAKRWEYNETVNQLYIGFRKVCDSVRLEVLCSILMQFDSPMKIIRLNKISLHSSVLFVTFSFDSCFCYRAVKSLHFKNEDLQHWCNVPYSDLLW